MNRASDSNTMVRLAGVTKSFGRGSSAVTALRGIHLDCGAGRLIMLAGPSGCGKTTLLSIISGILSQTSGDVEVCGVRWSGLNHAQQARCRAELVGYVFQHFQLIPTLTIQLNVAAPLLARGVRYRVAMKSAARSLSDVGLDDRRNAMPAELSGGMQQRVALARALVAQPRLLICDEPTANLDRTTGELMMQMLHAASRSNDISSRARTVIVVTHDFRTLRFADLIYQMEDGRLWPANESLLAQVWQAAMETDTAS